MVLHIDSSPQGSDPVSWWLALHIVG